MSDIHKINIPDIPEESVNTVVGTAVLQYASDNIKQESNIITLIFFTIKKTNVIRISKANLSHLELKQMMEKQLRHE